MMRRLQTRTIVVLLAAGLGFIESHSTAAANRIRAAHYNQAVEYLKHNDIPDKHFPDIGRNQKETSGVTAGRIWIGNLDGASPGLKDRLEHLSNLPVVRTNNIGVIPTKHNDNSYFKIVSLFAKDTNGAIAPVMEFSLLGKSGGEEYDRAIYPYKVRAKVHGGKLGKQNLEVDGVFGDMSGSNVYKGDRGAFVDTPNLVSVHTQSLGEAQYDTVTVELDNVEPFVIVKEAPGLRKYLSNLSNSYYDLANGGVKLISNADWSKSLLDAHGEIHQLDVDRVSMPAQP